MLAFPPSHYSQLPHIFFCEILIATTRLSSCCCSDLIKTEQQQLEVLLWEVCYPSIGLLLWVKCILTLLARWIWKKYFDQRQRGRWWIEWYNKTQNLRGGVYVILDLQASINPLTPGRVRPNCLPMPGGKGTGRVPMPGRGVTILFIFMLPEWISCIEICFFCLLFS